MIFTERNSRAPSSSTSSGARTTAGSSPAAFCQHEFEEHGLKPVDRAGEHRVQPDEGHPARACTSSIPPAAETKLVRCTRGAIVDIIVDLRPESPTYLQHVAVELNEDNRRALYVPERFAHGYQVLRDDTETSTWSASSTRPGPKAGFATTIRGWSSTGRCRSR